MLSSSTSNPIQLRAAAERERRRRGITHSLARYQFAPDRYITEQLGWSPWAGSPATPGQLEVIQAYTHALRQQHERDAYERGDLGAEQLTVWAADQVIKNRIRIEAGHTVGKTKLASGLVNHFFDCFAPSIIYTYAPTWEQIHDLLWKEIKADRRGRGLPGRILDLRLEQSDEHFAAGKATNNAGGQGTERAQGQHGPYLMFVLDEAEGIADFVYNAIDSMTSGGIAIVLMLANPRTRTSRFHKAQSARNVESFRISCIHHPNVLAGREVIPGAVRREYVQSMIDNGEVQHATVVAAHDDDQHTFELPWQPGVIYQPDAEFMFRVLGIAPGNIADNTFVPVGRFEAALKRPPPPSDPPHVARLGVDVARYGKDHGTLYVRHAGVISRVAIFTKQDGNAYARAITEEAARLAASGVTSLHVRVDGGGGFGGNVVDKIKDDHDLARLFADFQVYEVHFNGTPYDDAAYADLVTEMYAHTGEALKRLRLAHVPDALLGDLCERTYRWVKVGGQDVKKLTPKEDFKKREHRSPDDGDGCVLAVAPDYLFSDERTFDAAAAGQNDVVARLRAQLAAQSAAQQMRTNHADGYRPAPRAGVSAGASVRDPKGRGGLR